MGSKMVGFRAPTDEIELIEKKASELGITVADFLRQAIDDALYPTKNKSALSDSTSTSDDLNSIKTKLADYAQISEEMNQELSEIIETQDNFTKRLEDVEKKIASLNDIFDGRCKGISNANLKMHDIINSDIDFLKKISDRVEKLEALNGKQAGDTQSSKGGLRLVSGGKIYIAPESK